MRFDGSCDRSRRDTPAQHGRAGKTLPRVPPGSLAGSCTVHAKAGASFGERRFELSQMWTKNGPGSAAQRQWPCYHAVPDMRPARPSEVKERRRLDQKLASAPGMMVRRAIGEVRGTLIQLNIGPAEGVTLSRPYPD
jgi:hypothetical protein